jgi:hypothetical protein
VAEILGCLPRVGKSGFATPLRCVVEARENDLIDFR